MDSYVMNMDSYKKKEKILNVKMSKSNGDRPSYMLKP